MSVTPRRGRRGDAALLRLLQRRPPLESADDWERAERAQDRQDERELRGGRASEALDAGLPSRLDRVVPSLPEYSASVTALVEFCYSRYPAETNAVLVTWVHNGNSNMLFRRWLLDDWIESSHLLEQLQLGGEDGNGRKASWHEAIFLAALSENDLDIRRRLLFLLDKLGNFVDDTEPQQLANHSHIKHSVTALLDFCWQNAFALSRFSLLCAVKIRRVFEHQRSALPPGTGLPDQEEVAARMRWSLLTRPALFQPLLRHLLLFGVFTGCPDVTNAYFVEHPSDSLQLFAKPVLYEQSCLRRLSNIVENLEAACKAGAVHLKLDSIEHDTILSKSKSVAETTHSQALERSTAMQLMDEFECDLDDVPPHLFPCKLVLDLHAARLSWWKEHPSLYVDVCEHLYTASQLQAGFKAQWAVRIALQQLLLECDAGVLETNAVALSAFLPDLLLRLVHIRSHTSIK